MTAIPSNPLRFLDVWSQTACTEVPPAEFDIAVIVTSLPGAIASLSTTVSVIVPGVEQS